MADPHVSYRPSNGEEGCWFHEKWCAKCEADAAFRKDEDKPGCDILIRTYAFEEDHPDYPKEWREDGPEGPRCTAFRVEGTPAPEKIAADLARYQAAMAEMRLHPARRACAS